MTPGPYLGKVYVGTILDGACKVTVSQRGEHKTLAPRHDLQDHGPAVGWGASGGARAQLALAIAADALQDDPRACRVYQAFRGGVIDTMPEGRPWTMTFDRVALAIARIEDMQEADEEGAR